MKTILFFVVLVSIAAFVTCDQYMHVPRGSNNRLNEATATRTNGDRLFDSQNNNRGGYNVGDSLPTASTTEEQHQYMPFYEKSFLSIEWTNQHACGENNKVRCEHIIQYMCGDDLRDGTTTNTPPENADDASTGLHESREYYAACRDTIERNKGLWTADQDLNGDTAKFTRQNPNGNRRGYECPEERDYYPWWHDNPWKDIVILTSEPKERCDWYKDALKSLDRPSNIPCEMAVWSRDNHLGNSLDGYMASYNWTIPSTKEACGKDNEECKCVLRIRYNISTTDVDWFINSTFNDDLSPLQQNPTVDIGVMQGFQLAINTAQTGRTFQDRSHVFLIKPRPDALGNDKIYNVIVRGKRGNIVQTFPAVEYDFHPARLHVTPDDWVHWQWTGSNTHNNGGGGGDGQAGDDGQGTGGTDRNNLVEIEEANVNYPTPIPRNTMWRNVRDIFPNQPIADVIMDFASSGAGPDVDPLLNTASPSFVGPLLKFRSGEYHYMCTRNNNFSNRSQKGVLIVE